MLAERTGLEPATPGVTGRYSNQLNYRSALDLRLAESGCGERARQPKARIIVVSPGLASLARQPASPASLRKTSRLDDTPWTWRIKALARRRRICVAVGRH